MDILLDFDATVCDHRFPQIGPDAPLAVETLKRLTAKGHRLILFTMRSGDSLEAAVKWFEERQIPLYGIQTNPEQATWTTSPKAFGHMIIDDTCFNMPLIQPPGFVRPCVDWSKIREYFLIK